MRGKTKHQDRLFSYVPIEQRVSKTHLTEVVAEAERDAATEMAMGLSMGAGRKTLHGIRDMRSVRK